MNTSGLIWCLFKSMKKYQDFYFKTPPLVFQVQYMAKNEKSLRGFQIAIDMKEPRLITSKVVPSVPSTSECSKKCKHFPLYKSLQEIVFGPVSFFRVKTVGVSMNIIWIFSPPSIKTVFDWQECCFNWKSFLAETMTCDGLWNVNMNAYHRVRQTVKYL